MIDRHHLSGHSLYFTMAWTCVVVVIIVDHRIVDHSGSVDDFDLGAVVCKRRVVVENISLVYPSIRDKQPVSS
jgi:hypothetical protein